jgi:hypothetical protein
MLLRPARIPRIMRAGVKPFRVICVFFHRRGPRGAEKANEEIMESAAELHEARVLRARIEVKEAELAGLSADPGEASPDLRARLAAEIGGLKADYRRILARQADLDYRRRRAEWRAQQGAARARRDSACA